MCRFPTPEELWNRTFEVENAWCNRFAAVAYEDKGGTWSSRYYQGIAINNVLEAIAAGQFLESLYGTPPVRQQVHMQFTDKQEAFLRFVLQ